jgi:ribosomal protein S14
MKHTKLWRQANKRSNLRNIEIKKIILESVKNNKNIINTKRAYAFYKLIKMKKFKFKGHTDSCIISGKSRGVWKFCHLGRHKINELNKTGNILNIKSSSW